MGALRISLNLPNSRPSFGSAFCRERYRQPITAVLSAVLLYLFLPLVTIVSALRGAFHIKTEGSSTHSTLIAHPSVRSQRNPRFVYVRQPRVRPHAVGLASADPRYMSREKETEWLA